MGAMVYREYIGTSILASMVLRATYICSCPPHTHRVLGAKMADACERFEFPNGALQMIIISHKTTAEGQPCLPSMIYTAKLGIRATTTAILGHTSKGLAEARQYGTKCPCVQA